MCKTNEGSNESVTIPAWMLKKLTELAKTELDNCAEKMGMAGYTPSEQLQLEFQALETAEALLASSIIKEPEVVF